jgi:hypothetical protein
MTWNAPLSLSLVRYARFRGRLHRRFCPFLSPLAPQNRGKGLCSDIIGMIYGGEAIFGHFALPGAGRAGMIRKALWVINRARKENYPTR